MPEQILLDVDYEPSDSTSVIASGEKWSVIERTKHGGLRDGIQIIEVHNGRLEFSILAIRGMGLWRGRMGEIELGWQAPINGPVHPKYVNLADRGGLGWLTGFDEWLCRCGLNWNGPPGDDNGRPLTLHGRIANSPAHYLACHQEDDRIIVIGEVEEAGLFHARLRLRTVYATEISSNTIWIRDEVTNLGGQPAEMQLLYHCNFGPPLLGEGSRVRVPIRDLWPMTAKAANGLDQWNHYGPPTPGFVEEVFCMIPAADSNGQSLAILQDVKAEKAIALRWPVGPLPCFTVWKNTAAREDGYVTGLEPATNFPRFISLEREAGRVRMLAPGESWVANWSMEIADDPAAVQSFITEVEAIQSSAAPVIHTTPLV